MSKVLELRPHVKAPEPANKYELSDLSDIPMFHCDCGNNLVHVFKTGVFCPTCGNFTEPTK
jgi:hypothetical protein